MTITICTTDWNHHKEQLKTIREQVFIQEQHVPAELEWDDMDTIAIHVLAEVLPSNDRVDDKKLAIGTARIIINNRQAHIGRMAVLSQWRCKGVGFKILQHSINVCQQQSIEKIILNAQIYVTQFYQKSGFAISSDEFMDAGIPHKQMTLFLATPQSSNYHPQKRINND